MNVFTAKCVLKRFIKNLSEKYGKDPEWMKRYASGDDSALDELMDAACLALRESKGGYLEALSGSSELRSLQKKMIGDVVIGPIGGNKGIESQGAK